MHQQMLARYDAERRSFGLAPVESLFDYRLPIPEGYEANLPGFSHRLANSTMRDFEDYKVFDHEDRRDRLIEATHNGFLVDNGTQKPITPSLLASTFEANADSVEKANWDDGLSFYGNLHNYGHGLIAGLPDPSGPFPNRGGVMRSTSTAMRDPVFYRWHRHMDDLVFLWQENLRPNDFETGAPLVVARKGLGGETPENQSPDIFLCLGSSIPGAGESGFDGQAFGEATFGGDHWDSPPLPLGS